MGYDVEAGLSAIVRIEGCRDGVPIVNCRSATVYANEHHYRFYASTPISPAGTRPLTLQ